MADEPGGVTASSGDARPAEKLTEDWSRVIPVADPADAKYGQWRVWVQDGWLLVERRTGEDEIEWKIVLAKVVGDEPPAIVAERLAAGAGADRRDPRTGAVVTPGAAGPVPRPFRLSYREGRYFIRDEFGSLRCLREPKREQDRWPEIEVPPGAGLTEGSASGGPGSSLLTGRVSNSWFTVFAQPATKKGAPPAPAEGLVRLYHTDQQRRGGPQFTGRRGAPRVNFGAWSLIDDGELLVAEKVDGWRSTAAFRRRGKSPPADIEQPAEENGENAER